MKDATNAADLALQDDRAERTQFLVDVLSTAVEVGVSYWGAATHVEDHTGTTPDGDNLDPLGSGGNCYAATIYDLETGHEHTVNLDTIALGAARLAASAVAGDRVHDFRVANRTNGARGDIDADDADMALQMGLFGAIIYS
ncbi:MAG TPA: hypothetical protein H9878_16825 [Candidatus Dietzia merdigallinarum]|nr:hypothetical protein [Candidatus Dietzia merdigallinarum]